MKLRPFNHSKEVGPKHMVVWCIKCNAPVYHGFFDTDGVPYRDYYCTPCGNQALMSRPPSKEVTE